MQKRATNKNLLLAQTRFLQTAKRRCLPRRIFPERLGFVQLGTIPGGFRAPDGGYRDICPYIRVL